MFSKLWNALLSTLIGKIIITLFISMIPVIELRGAIPIATVGKNGGIGLGLNFWIALPVAIIGNLIPVPFIIVFIRKIFAWLRIKNQKLNSLVAKLENRAAKKSEVVKRYQFWGLVTLVAIPLPGTGAWTGALVATMLDMRLKKAFPAISLGVVIAAAIVAIVTHGVGVIVS